MKNHYLLYSLLLLLFWNTVLPKLYAQGDVPNFQLNGDATQLDNLCYQLTEASQWQTGSIWCYNQISLNQSFQVEFMLSFGCLDSAGADGIVFGFQPVDVSLGTVGEDIGFGFIAPSVGIEFDTYTNSNKGDPDYDHIAIIKNGNLAHWSGDNLAGPVQANANNPNIEDCNQHIVKVIWDAASTTLSVYFDCELRLTYTGNVVNTVFGGNPMVYWGFTSGTGGFGSIHQVCMIDATFFDPNPDTNLCQGESSQLTAPSGASYAWSPTTGLSSASSKITTATPNVSTIYTVTVTQICGATSTYAYEVTVNASPQPNIVGNSQFCAGGSTNLSLSAPFSTYQWSNAQTTASINANTANNYAVTVTDLNGCTGTDALTVTQVGGLTPIIIPSGSLCPGSSITLNTSETFAQYSWSNIQTTANITVSSPNTYTVTVTNASGCTGTGQITIGYTPIAVQINGNLSFCAGSNTILSTQNSYAQYTWSTGANTPTANINSAQTITVTVTDATGCTGTASAAIIQDPNPTASITGNTTFCTGNTTTLDAGAGYVQYAWSTGDVTQTATFNASDPNVTVTVTDSFGCTGTANTSVSESAGLSPSITGNTTFCTGNTTTLDAGAGYAQYIWSTGANTPTANINSAQTITVTVTDATGCTGTASAAITQHPNPTPSITGNTTFCTGNTTTLDAGAGYITYLWSTGDVTQTATFNASDPNVTVTVTDSFGCTGTASASVSESAGLSPSITGNTTFCTGNTTTLDAGAGYVQYAWSTGDATQTATFNASDPNVIVTVTDSFGCTGTANTSVSESAGLSPIITGNTTFCTGNTTTLDAGAGYITYLWSTGDVTQTATFNASNPNVTVTVTDSFGCTGTASASVSESAGLSPSITGNTTFCTGNTTTLDAGAGYVQYAWSTGDVTQTATFNASNPNVSVTVTDSFGCTGTANTSVSESAGLSPIITGNTTFCTGNTTTLDAGAGYVQYAWSTGDVTQTATFNASDPNVIVTVTDSSGCTGTANTSVSESAGLSPIITGNTTFCTGNTTTLDAGAGYVQYAWSTGDVTQTATFNASDPNVTVTVTDSFGCTGTANTSVSESAGLSPIITGNTTFCTGNTTTLDAGAGYVQYAWSTGDVTQTATFNASDPNVTVTVTDSFGCTGTANTSVSESAGLSPIITGNTTFCTGNTTTLDAGAGYITYLWSTGDVTQTATFDASDPNVSVTVTDSFGCTGTANTSVSESAGLSPIITGNTTFCTGNTTTLDAGAGYITYLWSTGDVTQTATFNASDPNVTVTVTDSFGCTGTASASVSESAGLSPSITGNTTFCTGNTTTLDAGAGYVQYAWSTGDVTQTATFNASDPNVTVTVTDSFGCTGTASASVSESAGLSPSITGNTTFCTGNTTTLDAGAGYVQYAWSTGDVTQTATFNASDPNVIVTVTDSFGCTGTANTSVSESAGLSPIITGNTTFCTGNTTTLDAGAGYAQYIWSTGDVTQTATFNASDPNVIVTVTDSFGCTGTANTSVSESAGLSPIITGNTTFCTGNTTTLDAGAGYVQYAWSTGDVTQTATFNASDPNVTVTVTDSFGCTGTASVAITQHPNPTPSISGALSFCTDGFTTLSCTGYSTYLWSTGETSVSVSITTPGTVNLTVTDANGCVGSQQTVVTEQAYLVPSITGSTDFCEGNTASIAAETGYTSYVWTTGNTNNQINIDEGGVYTVTVSDASGCTGTSVITVTMHPSPDPSISGNLSFAETSSTVLSAVGGNYNSYAWSSGSTEASIEVNNGGIYIVAVTDANGCTGSAAAIVTEKSVFDVLIPNAFSPNNDGVNDVFRIVGLHIQSVKILITDRWGQEVYNSTDTKQGWDGTTNGIEREMDVYAYTVWVKLDNGREKMYHGNVTLIR
jgi:gliding motility-associated-like protein